ncbi:M23 family metallopeptidase [Candidatus Odyssella thessalonicensis]|uniref:M23 family metallopeptidase n=1 Tax=Candidatus Odyssella thessalonicensis TaxID=84647 RepID=UPI000225BAE2|nr:M23 family metallopeptidase [Candidatus Odyssella thessalonicensis]
MKLRNFAIILMAASILVGCNSRRGGPADVEYDSYKSPYHIVRRGDTIASIAKKYHLDKKELVRLNGMKSPYRIVVGQKLLVGAHASTKHDDHYEPGADAPHVGEVKVSKLAPLPGTEEESATVPYSEADEEGEDDTDHTEGGLASHQEEETHGEESAREAKTYKPLNEAPKAAAFYTWPVRGKIIKAFSSTKGGHTGINISAPKGTPVKAANNGVVSRTEQIPGYGKVILIRHQNGFISVYAHLDQILVKRGDTVAAGQKIGTVGKTGNVKEPQLHFKLNKGKTPIDPTKLLD